MEAFHTMRRRNSWCWDRFVWDGALFQCIRPRCYKTGDPERVLFSFARPVRLSMMIALSGV